MHVYFLAELLKYGIHLVKKKKLIKILYELVYNAY